jgi:hypothetical protein
VEVAALLFAEICGRSDALRYLEDPRQTELFDVFADILSPVAYRRLTSGWQHLLRCAILKLMPAGKLAEHFDPTMGRPTKELYSMAGLLFIMEFRNLTHEEAADAYMFGVDVQYALNLQPENQSLCRRTIERYIKLFRDDEMAQAIKCNCAKRTRLTTACSSSSPLFPKPHANRTAERSPN